MIRVQVFSGEAGIRELAPAWRSLTAQLPSRRHFHHVEWYLALAETLQRHNLAQLECVAVFSASTLVAVFPFRRMPMQFATMDLRALRLASDQIDSQTARDFIIAPDLVETGFLARFVEFMAKHDPAWEIMHLPGILDNSSAAAALKHNAELPYLLTPGGLFGRIELITCGENDRPFERLSKGFKQNLRTSHNKLKAEQVTFEVARTQTALTTLFPEFLNVESAGWKGDLGTSALKEPWTNTFLRQLISHFGPSGGCEIHVMRVNGKPIATLFGIVTNNIWYILRIGYDEAYHQCSPGHLILENLLKPGTTPKPFNVLTPYNAPPWFHAWKPDKLQQIFNGYIFRPSPKGIELANRAAVILQAQASQPPKTTGEHL
jgi:CelD/BcsL family acetyltransferase involved in cellulose biosynthesis